MFADNTMFAQSTLGKQHIFAGFLGLFLCSVAPSLYAQPTTQEQPQQQPPPNPPPAPNVLEARQHFAQGSVFYERENYAAAIAEFERAYELLQNNPNQYTVLFNVAQTYERLFRYDLALRSYQRYLDEGADRVRDRAEVEATMRTLEALLATIEITVNLPNAEVWVDDIQVGSAPGNVRIPGGRHLMELRAPGYLPSRQEVQAPARSRRSVSFTMQALGRGGRFGISPAFFFTGVGLTTVSLVVGIAVGATAANMRADVNRRLDDPVQRFTVVPGDQEAIRRNALIADIFFGGTALFAVGSGILFFVTDWRGNANRTERPTQARVYPLIDLANGQLGWAGTF